MDVVLLYGLFRAAHLLQRKDPFVRIQTRGDRTSLEVGWTQRSQWQVYRHCGEQLSVKPYVCFTGELSV